MESAGRKWQKCLCPPHFLTIQTVSVYSVSYFLGFSFLFLLFSIIDCKGRLVVQFKPQLIQIQLF